MSKLNIKQPLNWFWIFYRFDKINQTIDEKKCFQQKLKFCLQMFILLLFLIQNSLLYFGNKQNSIYQIILQIDVVKHMGTGHELVYLFLVIGTLFSIALALLLNQSNSSHYKWFEIIEVLNECKDFHRIGLNDYKFVEKYLNLIRKLIFLIKISLILTFVSYSLLQIFLVLIGFDLHVIHIWIIFIIWYLLYFTSVIPQIYYSFLFYFIVYQNIRIRIISLREYLKFANSENLFLRWDTMQKVIKTSDKIFTDINSYNKFWGNYLQIVYYFLTPFNLILINLTINQKLMIILRLIGGSFLVFTILINLVFNWSTASINNEINK